MPLTPEQTRLLSASFDRVHPLPPAFGQRFYERLFELDPALRPLFKGDPDAQARMFVNALALAMLNLTRDGRTSRSLSDLGARHGGYGVIAAHYDTFGEALLWALGDLLGDELTPELRAAWFEAYATLASSMRSAAGAARQAP